MANEIRAHLLIKGRVQGVGYRYFAQDAARALDIKGWVSNCPNGDVEADAEGPQLTIEEWIDQLRKGPPIARVEEVQVTWLPVARQFSDFSVR
jgi:acylphosphatase